MANERRSRLPRKASRNRRSEVGTALSDGAELCKSVGGAPESVAPAGASGVDLGSLLERSPSDAEAAAWRNMSPGLRRRAATRIELLRRWTGDRGGLTAKAAAGMAEVEPNRFYQMVTAWRSEPGLMAVGAFAAAGPERPVRIDTVVNAALQAGVVGIVAAGKGSSVESMRRELESDLRVRVPTVGTEAGPRMPSPKTVRAVIAREQARVAQMRMLGESLVLDCCPTAMRGADGTPFDLFCLIDRGTLRIFGQAIGSLGDSLDGYRRVAIDAARRIGEAVDPLPWSVATRRIDIVIGSDAAAWRELLIELKTALRPADVAGITRDKRFGSQFRQYIGERVGGIWLRPTWISKPPPPLADGAEVFTLDEARVRADTETSAWNASKVIPRRGGAMVPPDGLLKALRLLSR